MKKLVFPLSFVLFVLVFFYQVFLGKLPVPTDTLVGLYHPWRDLYAPDYPRGVPFKNFLITDPVRQQIPWRKIAVDGWKQGNIPWWNPYSFSGAPLAGNIQAAVFYPLNILFLLFSFPYAWTILVMLQPLLAGIFMFYYLRNRNLHPASCLVGSIAWSFSGFSVSWLTWGTIVQTALWLPLILLSVDKVLSGIRRWWIVLATAIVCTLLAGHAQIALYCLVFSLMYSVIGFRSLGKKSKTVLWDLVNALAVSVFVTLIQWLPMVFSFIRSARSSEEIWDTPGFFLPLAHLVQFIAPDFFGNPATLNYWGTWNWAEFAGYIGIIPIIFALYSLISNWKASRFFGFTIAISLLFMLPTPIAKLFYWMNIPVLSSLQPTRLMVIVDFALAALAAIGIDAYISKPRKVLVPLISIALIFFSAWVATIFQSDITNSLVSRRNLMLPTGLFMLATVAFFAGKYVPKLRNIVLFIFLGLTVVDLLRFGWKFTPFTPKEYFFPETRIISYLKNVQKPFRVMSLDEKIVPPNVLGFYGIETIEGYDPIYSARYESFFAALARGSANITPPFGFNRILTTKNIDSPLLPLMNVRFVLSLVDIDRPNLTQVMQEGETRLYELTQTIPRIELAEKFTVVQTKEDSAIIEAIMKGQKQHRVVVPSPLDILSLPLSMNDSVTIVSYAPNNIKLKVITTSPRLLVVRNTFDPGWRAEVDGIRKNIISVDYIFWGIVVPGGSHKVILRYQ